MKVGIIAFSVELNTIMKMQNKIKNDFHSVNTFMSIYFPMSCLKADQVQSMTGTVHTEIHHGQCEFC